MKDFHFNISPQQQERMIRGSLLAELEFVYAFIDQQNGQLNKYLEEFNCESETSEAHGFLYEPNGLRVSGLSAFEYDLNGVFKEELPEYIRRSQVVILWAMLERSLRAIMEELYGTRSLTVPKKKKGDSDFIHLIQCLEKIDGKYENISHAITFLNDNARYVRNYIVHGGNLRVTHKFLEVCSGGALQKISEKYISEIHSAIVTLGCRL
jgi:hypothetical protein